MLISVIVPVHNAAPWLDGCLSSIESQTVGELEVICVDDGSTDESIGVLSRASARWDNLVVYRQECKGVSAARNAGLSRAQGEYILFVDADDLLDGRLLERVLPVAHGLDADMTIFGFEEYWGSLNRGIARRMCAEQRLQGRAFALEEMEGVSTSLVTPNVWRILWKRSFLQDAGLAFHEDLATSEDLAFIYEALFSRPRIALVNEILYRYRRDGGTTLTRSDRGLAGFRALRHVADHADTRHVLDDERMSRHFVNLILDVAEYAMGSAATEGEYRELYRAFQNEWRPYVEESGHLIAERYRPFWDAMRSMEGEEYLFDLYRRIRGDFERVRADAYARPREGMTSAGELPPVAPEAVREAGHGRYARVIVAGMSPMGEADAMHRTVEALRRAGHAVLPIDGAGMAEGGLAPAAAVRSFRPTAILCARGEEGEIAPRFGGVAESDCPVVAFDYSCGPDEAYWRLAVSKESLVRAGIACVQPWSADRAAQLEDACAKLGVARPVVFDASWPRNVETERPGSNPAYWLRTTRFAVYFAGGEVPSATEVSLRIAEGNLVLCEEGAQPCNAPQRLLETLVVFPVGGLSSCVSRMAASPDAWGSAYDAQRAATRALESLDDALLRCLEGTEGALSLQQRAVQVGLYGWFGAHNFGDDLLMALAIARLERRYPNLYPWIIGAKPAVIGAEYGYEAFEPGQKYAIERMLRDSCALVYCGGLIFDDPMAPTAGDCEFLFDSWIEPAGQAGIALLAQSLGVQPVFYCGGAGPIAQEATRLSVRLMGLADALFLCRDQRSCDLIEACGVDGDRVRLRADLAYGCRKTIECQADDALPADLADGGYFMVSLRRWHLNPDDFARRAAGAIDAVVSETGLVAAFVPFDAEDAALHREVARCMASNPSRYRVLDERPTMGGFFALLRGSVFAVAMRLHCSILHHVLGKPAVGFNYNDKIEAHFEKVGELDRLVALDADPCEVARIAVDAWSNRTVVAKRLAGQIAEGARLVDVATEELCGAIDRVRSTPRPAAEICYPRTIGRHMQELIGVRRLAERRACDIDRLNERNRRTESEAAENIKRLQDRCDRLERDRKADVARLTGERDVARREIENIHASVTYRLGRVLTRVPAAIREWWRKRRGERR